MKMLKFMYDTDSLEYPNLRVAYYKFEGADYRDDLRLLEKTYKEDYKVEVDRILSCYNSGINPITDVRHGPAEYGFEVIYDGFAPAKREDIDATV